MLLVGLASTWIVALTVAHLWPRLALFAGLGLVGLVAALGGLDMWGGKPRRAQLWCLVFALGGIRGGWPDDSPVPVRAVERGPARLIEYVVASNAWPGPTCGLRLLSADGLERDAQLRGPRCDFVAGDRFASHRWPRVGPGGRLHFEGPILPRARAGSAGSRALVARRHRAWEATRGRPRLALTAAAALGLRRALPPDRRAELAAAGLGHLLAISGLHIGLAALLLAALARRLVAQWRPRRLGVAALAELTVPVGLVAAYVVATGASASAVRAGCMAGCLFVGRAAGHPLHRPSLLLITAALMCAWRPDWLVDPSFQLSFVAVAALLALPPSAGPLLASWRVTWALAPLAAWYFGRIGWVGIAINLVAIPVFSLVTLPLSLLGWWLPPGALSEAALALAQPSAALILDLARLGARVPETGPRGWIAVGLVALLITAIVAVGRGAWAWARPRAAEVDASFEDSASRWAHYLPRWAPSVGLVLVGCLRLFAPDEASAGGDAPGTAANPGPSVHRGGAEVSSPAPIDASSRGRMASRV